MRVGILSLFYGNYNYGGKLQAYALTRVLEQMGHEARQIQYSQPSGRKKATLVDRVMRVIKDRDYRHAAAQKGLKKVYRAPAEGLRQRKAAFDRFDSQVPHTEQVYSDADICQTAEQFEAFIVGSDQVWNPELFKKGYFLDFLPKDAYRFSYAASVANELTPQWQAYFQEKLADFGAVSVREQSSQRQLSEILGQEVSLTADPTLLLSREEWDSVADDSLVGKKPYLLCYFLGYSAKARTCARRFAKAHGLELVTLPHLLGTVGRYYYSDVNFGDRALYAVTPAQFVSLVAHASYVMTDSFHATVLSLVFQRQFLVMNRTGRSKMGSRLDSLLDLFDLRGRWCPEKELDSRASELLETPCVYGQHCEKLECLRAESLRFLKENLEKAQRSRT